ncbi:hypothetical protein QH639_20055 [Lysinibacillus sp. 1 U-2021]|uniref:hypothetical protein n=1 Tax=Lysinibacillus sp. 1 U-2021 TaxID=3039426 RepID=UPI002480D76B|nr:hypothetical protein [Lysinibacillus sp. 1 U-2021]WGT38093.1 hypothetical protein QH639_20055 [Lysinibacillus sp. 1 U-2021]
MTHFEYMEQQGQLSIFDLEDQYEEMKFKKASTSVSKPVDKKMYIEPRMRVYIVSR